MVGGPSAYTDGNQLLSEPVQNLGWCFFDGAEIGNASPSQRHSTQ